MGDLGGEGLDAGGDGGQGGFGGLDGIGESSLVGGQGGAPVDQRLSRLAEVVAQGFWSGGDQAVELG